MNHDYQEYKFSKCLKIFGFLKDQVFWRVLTLKSHVFGDKLNIKYFTLFLLFLFLTLTDFKPSLYIVHQLILVMKGVCEQIVRFLTYNLFN